jgi:hypothetical protein
VDDVVLLREVLLNLSLGKIITLELFVNAFYLLLYFFVLLLIVLSLINVVFVLLKHLHFFLVTFGLEERLNGHIQT